ncbi:Transcriptional regulatory protein BaeR [Zhongshania aliphaticivorans]|uniref:Transcriptional regulatory protein BaeR n=1 Tax=Zhongshania aliphaticivorans TaxID=1470434 RepID=A0A5S9Q285_9GAMM|nr:response regulator [Zhongshania aliphaticivorans]CAA0111584.1 Transcriptional regulatory protein BaeR [Zhongshania aliphaticivorans]CAA0118707.1 Transcriptional regulatory protein BaeR [Zhongshania aliphaticivorans]
MSKLHILIVEDEVKIAQLLAEYFERDQFTVSMLHDGNVAETFIRNQQPDFVILDLMLPGRDGISICRGVRQFSDVPIMMLTAKIDEIDRLLGLELGADDYVCKPFSPREVVTRVRAILRRCQNTPKTPQGGNDDTLIHHNIRLNLARFECAANDVLIDLTPVEFQLLYTLIAQPGRVFSREQLMDSCYKDRRIVNDRTVDTHIKNLRNKLAKVDQSDVNIRAIYGVGYKID